MRLSSMIIIRDTWMISILKSNIFAEPVYNTALCLNYSEINCLHHVMKYSTQFEIF